MKWSQVDTQRHNADSEKWTGVLQSTVVLLFYFLMYKKNKLHIVEQVCVVERQQITLTSLIYCDNPV